MTKILKKRMASLALAEREAAAFAFRLLVDDHCVVAVRRVVRRADIAAAVCNLKNSELWHGFGVVWSK